MCLAGLVDHNDKGLGQACTQELPEALNSVINILAEPGVSRPAKWEEMGLAPMPRVPLEAVLLCAPVDNHLEESAAFEGLLRVDPARIQDEMDENTQEFQQEPRRLASYAPAPGVGLGLHFSDSGWRHRLARSAPSPRRTPTSVFLVRGSSSSTLLLF